jgi:glutamyl-tRNA synthetase
MQKLRGLPPVYDRAALALDGAARAALTAEGRVPHWRFRLSGQQVSWRDGVRGETRVDTSSLSDPVLVKADGTVLYSFASVVDDADMGVTDIIRGEDHVTNTAVQIELFRATGAEPPRFAHLNLIVAASGEEMSKRTGSQSLRSFREAGAEPMAVAAIAALAGTSRSPQPFGTLEEMVPLADLDAVSRSPARFDLAEIMQLSARCLHRMEPGEASRRLGPHGLPSEVFEAFWLAVRGNLGRMAEAADWRDAVFGRLAGRIDEPGFLALAADHLPGEPFDGATFKLWTAKLRDLTGRKGKDLFMPLRLALTGLEHGPEMAALLPLMGRAKVLARLRGQCA